MKITDRITGYEDTLESPIQAFHEVKYLANDLREVVFALRTLGLPVADKIESIIEDINVVSQAGANLYSKEISDRLIVAQSHLGDTLIAYLELEK